MYAALDYVIGKIEGLKITVAHIIATVIFVGFARSLMEFFGSAVEIALPWRVPFMLHVVLFYLCAFFAFLWVLRIALPKYRPQALYPAVTVGVFIGLFPPVLDALFSFSDVAYVYFSEITWSLFAPDQAVGESLVLWLIIAFTGIYVGQVTRSLMRGLLGSALAYVAFQFLGWFIGAAGSQFFVALAPSLGVPLGNFVETGRVRSELAVLALQMCMILTLAGVTLALFVAHRYTEFLATLRRLPYALVWGALLIFAASLINAVDAYTVAQAVIVIVLYVCMQAENDYYDKLHDAIGQRASLLEREDLYIIRFIIALVVFAFAFFDPIFGILIGAFYLLGILYSHEAFRLRRHFVPASIIHGLAALIIMLGGLFQFSFMQTGVELAIVTGVAVAFGILANVRDYKDLRSDDAGGMVTLYKTLAGYGWSPMRVYLALYTPIALSTLAAVVVLIGMVPSVALYVAPLLLLTGTLPLLTVRKPKQSTRFAVVHVALLFLFAGLYVVPVLPI